MFVSFRDTDFQNEILLSLFFLWTWNKVAWRVCVCVCVCVCVRARATAAVLQILVTEICKIPSALKWKPQPTTNYELRTT